MKRILCLTLSIFLLLPLAACAGKDKPAEPTAAPTQAASSTETATDAAGTPIPMGDTSYDPDTDADNLYSCANIQLIEVDGGYSLSFAEPPTKLHI